MNTIDIEEKSELLADGDYQAVIVDCSITPENLQWMVEKSVRMIWKITSGRDSGTTISQRLYIYSKDPSKKKKQEKKLVHINKVFFGQNKKTDPKDYIGCSATISISSFCPADGQAMNYIKGVSKSAAIALPISPNQHYPIMDNEIQF
jgi:hypothetical protein